MAVTVAGAATVAGKGHGESVRMYRLAVLIALAGVLLLTGAGWIALQDGTASASAADADSGRGGSVWGADYFPNVPLTTHDGQRVRFFDDVIAGKVVAINFIYTTCPDSCPMETARLLEVKEILGDRVGKDVFFYSITIDPEHDTQEVLREFADSWGIGDGWKFLTGDEDDIVLLRRKLGVYIEDIQSADSNNHNLNLVIGNQGTGRWMRRSPFENPYVLADQLGSWLHNWKGPSRKRERNYADAPEIRTISAGEDLFRTRCSACHTIGGGDVRELAQRRVGPDLLNVSQRRDRQWLERWLAEPDKMLEEGDPVALALYARYDEVPMPNMRLNAVDVRQILGYIDGESRRIRNLRAAEEGGHGGEHALHAQHRDNEPEAHGKSASHDGHGEHGGHDGPSAHTPHAGHAPAGPGEGR